MSSLELFVFAVGSFLTLSACGAWLTRFEDPFDFLSRALRRRGQPRQSGRAVQIS